MPRINYIAKHKKKIGSGGQMDPDTLKRALIKALTMTAAQLEHEGFSHGTAQRLRRKVAELKLTRESIGGMTSKELHKIYYKKAKPVQSNNKIMPDIDYLQDKYIKSHLEAKTPSQKKLALTRKSVIELYYFNDPKNKEFVDSGESSFLSLSRVCHIWREHEKQIKKPVYMKEHEMAGEAEYDFTGVRLPYVVNGATHYATFIVAVLTGSRYIFVKAIANQSQPVVCDAIADSFRYFGGCPHVIRIDNFKAAVKKAARYQGQLTDEMINFKEFFNIGVFTCRSGRPKDKGAVEAAVKYVTRYALSIANNHVKDGNPFSSLDEINSFIAPHIARMNECKVRGMKSSRKELFDIEKGLLQQPVSWDYRFFESFIITVSETARFTFEDHTYAIPSKWIGQKVTVHTTNQTVSFLSLDTVIVSYKRMDGVQGLSAIHGVIEKQHLIYDIFSIKNQEDLLLEWAEAIGGHVKSWCDFQLTHCKYGYADKIRYIHKFLTIVKANKAHYSIFDRCVKEHMYKGFDSLICSELIKIWDRYEKPAIYNYDDVYNDKTYMALGEAVILGHCDLMLWPLPQKEITSQTSSTQGSENQSRPKEFLNGHAVYDERFAYIKNQLS